MQFYKMLAKHYTEIFPLSEAVVKMVKENTPSCGSILDVGSAKGELVCRLASEGYDACGVEYVPELIGCSERTVVGDMHDLQFSDCQFDTVVCTGNTLVHSSEVQQVLGEFFRVLKSGGRAVVQILNYNRIMKNRPQSLPAIKTENVEFERLYAYEEGYIKFSGILKTIDGAEESAVSLYPLTLEEVKTAFDVAGFDVVGIYGGFDKSEFDIESSFPLVITAEKRKGGV